MIVDIEDIFMFAVKKTVIGSKENLIFCLGKFIQGSRCESHRFNTHLYQSCTGKTLYMINIYIYYVFFQATPPSQKLFYGFSRIFNKIEFL